MAVAILRRNRRGSPRGVVRWSDPFIVIAGVVVPVVILAGIYIVTLHEMAALSRPKDRAGLTIDVIGHMWWWEARYPNGAVTANEIHIPVGEPVRLALTSADVIHSFWVPQLQVKADQIPGRVNFLWLQADEPGRYRGQCAEFCGLQHAQMIFYVIADPPEAFSAWLAHEATPAARPASASAARGMDVFTSGSCAGCHTIRGTTATGEVAPDLTHLAIRETIGAGVLLNTRQDLARWVTNAQTAKPGAVMPPTELSPEDLQAVLDYLQSLE